MILSRWSITERLHTLATFGYMHCAKYSALWLRPKPFTMEKFFFTIFSHNVLFIIYISPAKAHSQVVCQYRLAVSSCLCFAGTYGSSLNGLFVPIQSKIVVPLPFVAPAFSPSSFSYHKTIFPDIIVSKLLACKHSLNTFFARGNVMTIISLFNVVLRI